MTISQRIRKAALGPTPRDSQYMAAWVGDGEIWDAVHEFVVGSWPFLNWLTPVERRMFLLFVAEALDD